MREEIEVLENHANVFPNLINIGLRVGQLIAINDDLTTSDWF